jgi:glyoxylase-like metal-dependent hydrolase (beta-lactamase superfamily II)
MKGLTTAFVFVAAAGIAAAQVPAARTGLLTERHLTAADFPQIKQLAPDVYVWSDVHPSGLYTTNDLIVITTDGVLVADGQKDAATTRKMVDRIAAMTKQPIRYVIVASEHGDHTGGNSAFPAGATFISSPYSKDNLTAQAKQDKPPAKTIVPTETVADRRAIHLGATDIDIVYNGRAHTGGDLEVYLPKEKIFFASEAFSNHLFPQLRAAMPTEWPPTLKKIQQVDASILVPGHGFIDSPQVLKEEFVAFQECLDYVIAAATKLHAAGVSVEDAQKQVDWGPYKAWPLADTNGPRAVQRVYDELDGKLK